MRKTILIIDDSVVNRSILRRVFRDEYDVLEAENGEQALKVLAEHRDQVSLMLLDLVMPVMDGYQFLQAVQQEPLLSGIPIVVETSSTDAADEIKCLAGGASDFVTKPYVPEIVKNRVASLIRLRDSAAMVNLLEKDRLTGLYTPEFFYQKVQEELDSHPQQEYDLYSIDIEQFKLINERYGTERGDAILKALADVLKGRMRHDEIVGRLGSDRFVICARHEGMYSEAFLRESIRRWVDALPMQSIVIKLGVYRVVDRSLPVSGMCDRATLALNSIKGKYNQLVAVYDDALRVRLLKEQSLVDDMERALDERQFKVYYQPKHDIQHDKLAGAEALVRWQHPKYGLISPGEFIPLFEKNGFISALDQFVWECACRDLQKWREQGLPPIPVSVNVSRADFDQPDLVEIIVALAAKYDLPPELLHLEVTESAYTQTPKPIIEAVQKLRAHHFRIEMDDFGSGYSSLNMLSELPVDVLKLDMRFVQKQQVTQKKSILSFIFMLAKWMELATVAEGVENQAQLEQLKGLGCQYVQGYYYAKPMCEDSFDDYLKSHLLPATPDAQ